MPITTLVQYPHRRRGSCFRRPCFLRPRVIAEIDTFIGRLAIALVLGADEAEIPCQIHTCDASNAINLPDLARAKIVQYQKQISTQMFRELARPGLEHAIDFLHLDSRLQTDDLLLLRNLLHERTVVALDDFEGVEKGVRI